MNDFFTPKSKPNYLIRIIKYPLVMMFINAPSIRLFLIFCRNRLNFWNLELKNDKERTNNVAIKNPPINKIKSPIPSTKS